MNSQPSSHNAQSLESISEYAERTSSHAAAAAASVTDTFVHRILGVPGALIGSVQVPDPRPPRELLPMTLPADLVVAEEEPAVEEETENEHSKLRPMPRRGPEITEIG